MPLWQRAQRQTSCKLLIFILTHGLKGYDEHLNLMLSDVEEKITTVDIDPMTK